MEYDEMNEEEIQAEVLKAEDRYEDLKDRVHYQYEEIQQLKKKYEIMKENAETLAKRIDKAIEYMNDTIDFSWKNNSPIKNGKSLNLNKLLGILQGVDKE